MGQWSNLGCLGVLDGCEQLNQGYKNKPFSHKLEVEFGQFVGRGFGVDR